MAGRPMIKCFEYNSNLEYVREYESVQSVRDVYFPNDIGNRPLFHKQKDYFKSKDGNFIANYRIGREALRKAERVRNCKFCKTNGNIKEKEVEVFNLLGIKVAEFKSAHIASLMTGISQKTVWARLNYSTSKFNVTPNRDNLEFKYKL